MDGKEKTVLCPSAPQLFLFLCKAYSHVVQGYLRVPSFIPDTYCIGVWYKLLPKICSDAEASQNGGPKMLSHTHRTHPVEQKRLTSSWQPPRLWSHSAVMNKIPHLISCIFAPLISSSTFRATSNKDYRKEKIIKVLNPTKGRWSGPEASIDVTNSSQYDQTKQSEGKEKAAMGVKSSAANLPP